MNWDGDDHQFEESRMSSFNSPGAGGGFLNKTFGESPGSQDNSKLDKKLQGICPITVAGIMNADYDLVSDSFVLKEVTLPQVCFVGMVTSVVESQTHLYFEIDDLTAKISVKRWLDKEENRNEYEAARFREDSYVRVYGYIKRAENNARHIVAFHMELVKDFNEITFHMLSAINASLDLRKSLHEDSNPDNARNDSFSNQNDLVENHSNLSMPQKKVHILVCQDTSQQGAFVGNIVEKLGISEESVREILDHLSNEGLVYSTKDDDHYRSTAE